MSAQLQPSQWRLLPMHPSHLPQVLEIEERAYPFPWTEGILKDCIKTGYSSWVITNTIGEVMAYSFMSMAVGEAHILNICVDPNQQRQGLGLFLMQHLITLARAANCTIVLLEVRKSNKGAFKLYDSLGFQRLGLRKNYYPAFDGREDAIVLGLELL
ncbi:MAG: ribosomal protein S18-alanine N-acetyltransferase [Pseudomonadota bacterium]